MTSFIIPVIVLIVIIYGLLKGVDIYDVFLEGVMEGLRMSVKIFPNIFGMIICVNVLLKSDIINDLSVWIEPVLNFFHYPKELVSLAIMRPISGNSSLILMDNILKGNGADSFVGRVASVLQGSTDTTVYIISLYFSSVGIKKIRYSLLVGLLADLMAVILSVIVVRILF